jgi:cytochrome b561
MAGIGIMVAREGRKRHRQMLALHRIGGYMFIALFCAMTYFMIARIRNEGGDISPTVTLHVALAVVLSPLLFIKVLIALYYPRHDRAAESSHSARCATSETYFAQCGTSRLESSFLAGMTRSP